MADIIMGTTGRKSFVFCLNKCKYPHCLKKDSNILFNKCNTLWINHEIGKYPVAGSVHSDTVTEVHHKTLRLSWCSEENDRFLHINSNGSLCLSQINLHTETYTPVSTLIQEWDSQCIVQLLQQAKIDAEAWPSRVQILRVVSNGALLLINGHLVDLKLPVPSNATSSASLSINAPSPTKIGTPSLLCHTQLSGVSDGLSKVQLIRGRILAGYSEQQRVIYFYKSTSEELASVNLDKLKPVTAEPIAHFHITEDLARLVLLYSDHKLQVIPLDAYFKHFPKDVHSKGGGGENTDRLRVKSAGEHWAVKCGALQLEEVLVPCPPLKKTAQKRKVSGFRVSSQNERLAPTPPPPHTVDLRELVGEGEVVGISGDEAMLYVSVSEQQQQRLLGVDLDSGDVQNQSLLAEGAVVLPDTSREPTCPLVLTPQGLYAVAFSARQEQLVNKLMLYEGTRLADGVCRLNEWDQCSIPLHTLEVGLKQRQLDTVAFYLKSREHAFSGKQDGDSTSTPPSWELGYDAGDLDQLDLAMELLTTTIRAHLSDDHDSLCGDQSVSKQFGEQLMHVTASHLHRVLQNIVVERGRRAEEKNSEAGTEFEAATDRLPHKITGYITDLRLYLRDVPSSHVKKPRESSNTSMENHRAVLDAGDSTGQKSMARGEKGEEESRSEVGEGEEGEKAEEDGLDTQDAGVRRKMRTVSRHRHMHRVFTDKQRKMLAKWELLDEKAVIIEGLLSMDVPLLQFYLYKRLGAGSAGLGYVVTVGLEEVIECLMGRDMIKAIQLLQHMGFNPISKLRQICLYTTELSLRDYLVSWLQGEGHLSAQEVEMVAFLRQLESLYPCRSFEVAKLLRREGNGSWPYPLPMLHRQKTQAQTSSSSLPKSSTITSTILPTSTSAPSLSCLTTGTEKETGTETELENWMKIEKEEIENEMEKGMKMETWTMIEKVKEMGAEMGTGMEARKKIEMETGMEAGMKIVTDTRTLPKTETDTEKEKIEMENVTKKQTAARTIATETEQDMIKMKTTTTKSTITTNTKEAPGIAELLGHCGELGAGTQDEDGDAGNAETAAYCHVVLEWLRGWEPEARSRIMLEQAMYRTDVQSAADIPSLVMWQYLCDHQDKPRLHQWIDAHISVASTTPAAWPYNQPITQAMIDATHSAPVRLREEILNRLAGHGMFCSREREDLGLLWRRLAGIGAVMRTPHPLESPHAPAPTPGAPALGAPSLPQLHGYVVRKCMEEQSRASFLYDYLDYWGLCETTVDSELFGDDIPTWVQFLLKCRTTSRMLKDPTYIHETSLWNDRMLGRSGIVEDMVAEGGVLRALATALYSLHTLQQFLSADNGELRSALAPYPRLQQALFPPEKDSANRQDVTVYSLMQGNTDFDMGLLFGWQKGHRLKSHEAFGELLHCSHPRLMAEYAHRQSLGFLHYLKQGRPAYALLILLSTLLTRGHRALAKPVLGNVRRIVSEVALRHYTSATITSSCSALLHMLGIPTTSLRLHLQAASLCHARAVAAGGVVGGGAGAGMGERMERMEERDVVKSIGMLVLKSSQGGRTHVRKLKDLLIEAVQYNISRHKIKSTSFEASQRWGLVYAFCRYHQSRGAGMGTGLGVGVPPSHFLSACARDDDWLMFLLHSHMHQLPPSIVKQAATKFHSPHLREHLLLVLDKMATKVKVTGPENGWAGKKTMTQARKQANSETSDNEDDDNSDTENDDGSLEPEPTAPSGGEEQKHPGDVFSAVLVCVSRPDAAHSLLRCAVLYRHPAMAVLAASFQEVDLQACLCGWLVASLPSLHDSPCEASQTQWSVENWDAIVTHLIHANCTMILRKGIEIFFPDCPLLVFLDFYTQFVNHASVSDCMILLHNFTTLMKKYRTISKERDTGDVLSSYHGTEQIVVHIINHHIETADTHSLSSFLTIIEESLIASCLTCETPDYSLLRRIHKIVHQFNSDSADPTPILIKYSSLLGNPSGERWRGEAGRLAGELVGRPQGVGAATRLAEVAGISAHDMLIKQLQAERERLTAAVWGQRDIRHQYTQRCHRLFMQQRINAVKAATFFKEEADKRSCAEEKVEVYRLAYQWLAQSHNSSQEREELVKNIWISKIQAYRETHMIPKDDSSDNLRIFKSDFTLEKVQAKPTVREPVALSVEEQEVLDILLGELLKQGRICDARTVAAHFSHTNSQLTFLQCCVELAHGTVSPSSMPPELRILGASPAPSPRGIRRVSTSFVSLPRNDTSMSVMSLALRMETDMESSGDDPVLSTLIQLSQHASGQRKCVSCIITLYRISKVLTLSFAQVLEKDEFALLAELFRSGCNERYALAKSYIQSSCLPDVTLAGFLCDLIVESLLVNASKDKSPSSPSSADRHVPLRVAGTEDIVQLCERPAVLGQRLCDAVVSLATSETDIDPKMLNVEVELLRYAHECYTLACNSEGISQVLHIAHTYIHPDLTDAQEWVLMLRMLCAIGRYGEMTYVFHTLYEHQQFSLVFQTTEKSPGLKIAVLDYLKRHQRGDVTSFTHCSVHFSMHREIGMLLQNSAQQTLRKLAGKKLVNNDEVYPTLKKALGSYKDAAEHLFKDNSVRLAEACVKQAALVALQMKLLAGSGGAVVINLTTPDGVTAFMDRHTNMHQSHIVNEAYGGCGSWPSALYQRVVRAGDMGYLASFTRQFTLTPAIVREVVDRCQSEWQQQQQQAQGTKQSSTKQSSTKQSSAKQSSKQRQEEEKHLGKFLMHCSDAKAAYELAANLNLQAVMKDMLQSDRGAYIKDALML